MAWEYKKGRLFLIFSVAGCMFRVGLNRIWDFRLRMYTPYKPYIYVFSQRGLTGEMSKYVTFLHSESSHLLPTQPTDTTLALNES